MIWKGIIGLASSKTAITDQIGSSPMRLFPILLPQGLTTFPAVAGKVVVNRQTIDFDGASDFDYVPYDFHCYGRTIKDAEETATIFRNELEGENGTYNTIEFNDVRFSDSGSDDYLDDLELFTYSIEITFNIRR
jgi:hypothetical protein